MNLIDLADKIISKSNEIDAVRKVLIERSDARDNAEANFNKRYAVVLIQLKNGVEFILDGVKIKDPPAASVKEIAKGICNAEKLELDKAESMLKIAFKNLEATQSQLTCYQSLFRHIENI